MAPKKHVVKQGEGIGKIAKSHGFYEWEPIWNDPANNDLRDKRKNPNVLWPGDILFIPEIQIKEVSGNTEERHRFMCKLPGMKEMLRIKIEERDGTPMAGKAFVLLCDDGTQLSGVTNGEGMVEQEVNLEIKEAKLEVEGNEWNIQISHLNPVDETTKDLAVSGAQARLNNLGFICPLTGRLDEKTKAAIKRFQAGQKDLTETGELDSKTQKALRKRHGS